MRVHQFMMESQPLTYDWLLTLSRIVVRPSTKYFVF